MATLAPVLARGRAEINRAWPGRLTQKRFHDSDGWIGNQAHQAKKSDHNPDGNGIVHAIDVDIDAVNVWALLAAVLRHPSTRYAILYDKIYHRQYGFEARKYTGAYHNHLHWSIEHTSAARNSTTALGLAAESSPVPAGGRMSKFATLRKGSKGAAVRTLQRAAVKLGSALTVDGDFGAATHRWAVAFQQVHKLTADGVVGPQTWCAIAQALLRVHDHQIAVDGRWGPKTHAATVAFQRAAGITADGVFGPATMARASQ